MVVGTDVMVVGTRNMVVGTQNMVVGTGRPLASVLWVGYPRIVILSTSRVGVSVRIVMTGNVRERR